MCYTRHAVKVKQNSTLKILRNLKSSKIRNFRVNELKFNMSVDKA